MEHIQCYNRCSKRSKCTLLPDTNKFIYMKELIVNNIRILALVSKIYMEDKK